MVETAQTPMTTTETTPTTGTTNTPTEQSVPSANSSPENDSRMFYMRRMYAQYSKGILTGSLQQMHEIEAPVMYRLASM